MALIKCPECGKEISSTCKSCVHCGYTLQTIPFPAAASKAPEKAIKKTDLKELLKKHKIATIIISAILLLVFVLPLFLKSDKDPFPVICSLYSKNDVEDKYGKADGILENTQHDVPYYNISILGKKAKMFAFYDKDNADELIDVAVFVPFRNPITARCFVQKAIKYYNKNFEDISLVMQDSTSYNKLVYSLRPDLERVTFLGGNIPALQLYCRASDLYDFGELGEEYAYAVGFRLNTYYIHRN